MKQRKRDLLSGALIFASTLGVFWYSPVHQVSDSKYSMLLSQALINYRSFALDHYNLPRLEPFQREDYVMDGDIYQLEIEKNHIYYFFPVGSSVLSLPYVAIANLFGLSASNPDGTYNHQGEIAIETGLAAILMAALALVFFFTARLVLPVSWSALISLGAAFGTQIWSTASRGLWSHTWSVFLLGVVLYLLLASETNRSKLRPILMATLLSWMYFVRPSNSIFIVAIGVYIVIYHSHPSIRFVLTGLLWLAAFMIYSWYHFGHLLPNYYRAGRLSFDAFHIALPGNLISPSRGLLIYVPALLFVGYLLARYRKYLQPRRLIWLALLSVGLYTIMISCFAHWWGGASFGPRFSTDAIPWFVLLSILAIKAMLDWREKHRAEKFAWNVQLAAGVLLLAISVFINGRGATVPETWKWNEQPKDVVLVQKKLWDWRQPQFLAGLIRPPLEHEYPLVKEGSRIDFTKPESDAFLWYGWSGLEPEFRWTEAREAALVFALNDPRDLVLKIRLIPFIARGIHDRQRLTIDLNGLQIASQTLDEERAYELSFNLQSSSLQRQNVLTFALPDAASPESLKLSTDQRPLGIAVQWIEFQTPDAGSN